MTRSAPPGQSGSELSVAAVTATGESTVAEPSAADVRG